jgi:hypothetical protein
MQDVGVVVGFNSKLELDCNIQKTQGLDVSSLGFIRNLIYFCTRKLVDRVYSSRTAARLRFTMDPGRWHSGGSPDLALLGVVARRW